MKTYKISDISIYPFNENGKKFVEEIRCYLNTNEKLTERINNIFDNGYHSHFHDVSNNGCEKIGGCIINYRKILKRYLFKPMIDGMNAIASIKQAYAKIIAV